MPVLRTSTAESRSRTRLEVRDRSFVHLWWTKTVRNFVFVALDRALGAKIGNALRIHWVRCGGWLAALNSYSAANAASASMALNFGTLNLHSARILRSSRTRTQSPLVRCSKARNRGTRSGSVCLAPRMHRQRRPRAHISACLERAHVLSVVTGLSRSFEVSCVIGTKWDTNGRFWNIDCLR
jgi:hypothetical protein